MKDPGFQRFRRGEAVAIRGWEEIAATLDADGKLEGLPFMPEMARFCGTRARVHRHTDKTCVEGAGFRRLEGALLLEELRCDGAFHDGCQRACLFFWKEAWLEPAERRGGAPARAGFPDGAPPLPTRRGGGYLCQSTELLAASHPLSRWDLRPFLREIRRGELSVTGFLAILLATARDRLRGFLGLRKAGSLAGSRQKTPRGELGLRAGDQVEVLSEAEIQSTLDAEGRNRGLAFEPGMTAYSGRRFEVDQPIERIILEPTGRMTTLTGTVALKGVTCQGVCSRNCPRNNVLYWRENWLKRV